MINKKDTINNIIGLIASAGLTMFTSQGTNLLGGLVNTIVSGILGNYVNDLSFKQFKHLIQDISPEDLNHDLKKLIIEAVRSTVQIICSTYSKKYFLKSHEQDRLNKFEKRLIKSVDTLKVKIFDNENALYKQIEDPKSTQQLFELFNIEINDFPQVHHKYAFGQYFKEQFISILQLTFGELLKDEKNKAALVAYQRDIYQTLNRKIDTTIEQNNLILSKLSSNEEKKEITNYNENILQIKYNVLDKNKEHIYSHEFEKNVISYFDSISTDVSEILHIVKGINQEISTNWISKNKAFIISSIILLLSIISILTYSVITQPFDMTIQFKKDNRINNEYPVFGKNGKPKITINLPDEQPIVQELNDDLSSVTIRDISYEFLNTKTDINLGDKYYTLSENELILNKESKTFVIKPNNYLSKIEGRVYRIDSGKQKPIENVKISSSYYDFKSITDEKGRFTINIPIQHRKERFTLTLNYQGIEFTNQCEVGSICQIRFNNIK